MGVDSPPLSPEEIRTLYAKKYAEFSDSVKRAFFICYGMSDLLVFGGRPKYRGTLYTKLCVSARSLLLVAPDPTRPDFATAHMDLSGCAALTRVVIDTFVSLFHIALDRCSAEEFQARELLVFWRDQHVRKKMDSLFEGGWNPDDRDEIESDLRTRLDANAFFKALPDKRRRHLLKKGDLLYSPDEILRQAGCDVEAIKGFYTYLSAHAHCDSVSFLFMPDQKRGRGYPSTADLALSSACLEHADIFVREGARLLEQDAPGSEARGRSIDGLDPLKNTAGPQWWTGKKLSELVPGARDD